MDVNDMIEDETLSHTHKRTAIRLRMGKLWEELHTEKRVDRASENTYWRETSRFLRVLQDIGEYIPATGHIGAQPRRVIRRNAGNEEDDLEDTENDESPSGPPASSGDQWQSRGYHTNDGSIPDYDTFKREPDTSYNFNSTDMAGVASMDDYRFPVGPQASVGHGHSMHRALPDRTVRSATGISPLSAVPRSMDHNYGPVSTHYRTQQAEIHVSNVPGARQSHSQTPALQNSPSTYSSEESANGGQAQEGYYSGNAANPMQAEDNYQLQASGFDDQALARYNASMAMQQPPLQAMAPAQMLGNEQYQLSQYGWVEQLSYQQPVIVPQPLSQERYYNAGVVQPLQNYLDIKEDEDDIIMPSARADHW
ncbi:MAG: hypothetical protein M1836_002637 [Candelina mexicana]|nr:MAG: hypothetical protein M1836_002637 [Candelina mexicana]